VVRVSQRYVEQFGLDGVYTPQAVWTANRERVGSKAVAIRNAVETATRSEKITLTLGMPFAMAIRSSFI